MAISYRLVRPVPGVAPVLTRAQQVVADHREGALLVLGGPRTGKTTALIEATVASLDDGVPEVLFLTGSRQARLDLRSRVGTAYPQLSSRVTVTTFYSFCQSVVRRFAGSSPVPAVLSATRQDFYIRQILAGQPRSAWPGRFDRARLTTEFAAGVREAVAACQREGLTPRDVRARGLSEGRDDWVGLAQFYQEYLDVLGLAGVLDYPELLIRARQLLADDVGLAEVRPAGSLIIVDDLEDIDPAQEEIVLALVDRSTPVILSTNPDAQVYGFRGARHRSTSELLHQWSLRGIPTGVVPLTQGYALPQAVCSASRGLLERIPLPAGIDLARLDAYRGEQPDRVGEVVKMVFGDPSAEADHIAWLLKQIHRGDHVPYEQMAIVVRKKSEFPRYAMACEQAGVPVAMSGDEIQLNREEIVTVLLAALRVVRDGAEASAADWRCLVESPLGDEPVCEDPSPESGAGRPDDGSDAGARPNRLGQVVAAGQAKLDGTAADVLWAVWQASAWQSSLVEQIGQTTGEGLRANRALDAVVALFSLASSFSDLSAEKGIVALDEAVRSQEVPEDLPRSSSWASAAVRLTTAHRAKGQRWAVVVVAAVEEGVWPVRPPAGPMVSVAGLTSHLVEPDRRQQLVAERRLLYAACAATQWRLVVTAVDDGERSPSVFFDQIGAQVRPVVEMAPLSAAGLVGQLRQVAADDTADPGLRQAACERLARLWGNRVFPGADPARWWGIAGDATDNGSAAPGDGPRDGVLRNIVLSASQAESLFDCPRRWYLSRQAGADRPATVRTRIGSLLHELVQDPGSSLEQMTEALAVSWAELDFPAAWQRTTEWEAAVTALTRYDTWRQATGREVLATEAPVDLWVDSSGPVEVRGRIDRIERDAQGQLWIVDFKSGRTAPTKWQAAANVQIGLYQLALQSGLLDSVLDPGDRLGGAELVYLRHPASVGSDLPKVFVQPSLSDNPYLDQDRPLPVTRWEPAADVGDQWDYPSWVHHRVALAAAVLRQDTFPAVVSSVCRACPFAHGCPAVRQVTP